ncbi:T9SS type A sorting domain-containing protein [bacterium]|nr:T9SS type A sorting domain-containing protein [bacterium]
MYVFFDENNPDDSVCVKVKYLGGTSSVKENLLSNIEFSNAYPNPANTQTSFDYLFDNEFKDAEIIISTLLGSTVRNVKLQDIKGKVIINTSALNDGVYFYS